MEQKNFEPYIPDEKTMPEFTPTLIISGILLAVVFGAANAYLGLRVGLTVSASIPAAVISMAVIRVILKKNSIPENNMVQTTGSAGESLAAGAIFTIPALFLWAKEGVMEKPSLVTIMLISLCGGLLGVLFMVPLRNALIVKEHNVLPYPEGNACAKVLLRHMGICIFKCSKSFKSSWRMISAICTAQSIMQWSVHHCSPHTRMQAEMLTSKM